MAKPKKRTLTESEWNSVLRARCKSKQGQALTPEERELVDAAWASDQERYGAMDGDVFNATVPAGSTVTWEKLRARRLSGKKAE